eukprot:CAMPEP_0170382762 /NCGR_PEP_ID=MMETSP0117_2-20130122/15119_1 /TAXON_ID=400756 /ORGANISM="Durinskia baltica, Strain CSIRO CS-38" /LENGTH=42 /DNA_ID= /DNA_START= /DNA_END= /DNA_ORIENTATION=
MTPGPAGLPGDVAVRRVSVAVGPAWVAGAPPGVVNGPHVRAA